jgi:hypothetical protein
MPEKPMYVRVRDLSTKHEYDLRETSPLIARGSVERVKDDRYPPSRVPRRPKHYLNLAGHAASRETGKASAKPEPSSAPAVAAEAPEKEH